MKKKSIIVILMLSTLIFLSGCSSSCQARYEDAQKKLSAGEYDQAIQTFKELGEYEDSGHFLIYAGAQKQLKEGNYEEALKNLKNLGDFKSSSSWLTYALASKLLYEGRYKAAYDQFNSLGIFQDSEERAVGLKPLTFIDYRLAFQGNVAFILDSQGKFGLIDSEDNVLISPQFDYITAFLDDLAIVYRNNKCGIINAMGEIVLEPVWDLIGYGDVYYYYNQSFFEGLALVKRGDKYGFINTKGEVVMEPIWDSAASFSEGLASVKRGYKYGFINTKGEVVIEPVWDFALWFKEGLAPVRRGYKDGFINTKGEVVCGIFPNTIE